MNNPMINTAILDESGKQGYSATTSPSSNPLPLPSNTGSEPGTVEMPTAVSNAGAKLLTDISTFLRRFCVFPDEHCVTAVTLWAAHTHMVEHFHVSPRLAVLSAELGSGKTRVLELLELLAPEPLFCLSASPAAIFRQLKEHPVTLLFDEVDTIFKTKGKDDGHEDLRALLNAGYKRGATIPRCVGPKHDVVRFPAFSATALAGIGDLPDTIMSRSIIIRMRRRAPDERVESFRVRVNEKEGHVLRDKLTAWARTVGKPIGEAYPELPDGIVDRAAEIWEPLIAIADAAGGDWPALSRSACVGLSKAAAERKASLGIRLLADLWNVFGNADAMHTKDIIERLSNGEEYGLAADAPWPELQGGKPISDRALAKMLAKYDIHPNKVRIGERPLQGYTRKQLWDVWRRYLPATMKKPEQPEQAELANQDQTICPVTGTGSV